MWRRYLIYHYYKIIVKYGKLLCTLDTTSKSYFLNINYTIIYLINDHLKACTLLYILRMLPSTPVHTYTISSFPPTSTLGHTRYPMTHGIPPWCSSSPPTAHVRLHSLYLFLALSLSLNPLNEIGDSKEEFRSFASVLNFLNNGSGIVNASFGFNQGNLLRDYIEEFFMKLITLMALQQEDSQLISYSLFNNIKHDKSTKASSILDTNVSFLIMLLNRLTTENTRGDQVNMAGLDMDVQPKKTITDEVIERYGKINGYEDTKDEREKSEITRRET
ncbi:hypothetical protein Syun_001406 [Stephania yunnanensis]|uniref:Uncharacterized protein n=1 Tax=Stephania yunnanensis TaxID=152371 RepID=A0AAP0LDV7_9MAGN